MREDESKASKQSMWPRLQAGPGVRREVYCRSWARRASIVGPATPDGGDCERMYLEAPGKRRCQHLKVTDRERVRQNSPLEFGVVQVVVVIDREAATAASARAGTRLVAVVFLTVEQVLDPLPQLGVL